MMKNCNSRNSKRIYLEEFASKRLAFIISCLISFFLAYGCSSKETSASEAPRTTPDILGVRIGMTPDEVQKVLQKESHLTLSASREQRWPMLTIKAEGKKEVLVVLFTETNPKAWFIGRSFELPPGERPLREAVAKRAIEKYGTPVAHKVMETPAGTILAWAWGKDNKQLSEFGSCVSSRANGKSWKPEFTREAPSVSVDTSYNPICDIYISTRIQGEIFDPTDRSSMPSLAGRREIAAGVSVSITSASLYRSDPKNPIDLAAARERAKLDAAAGAKAPRF